jgi:capsular polysaccharide biosynthesis protein
MLAGALLGAVLALAAELLDDTIRHPHQLAAAGVPVIGRLPRVGLMRRSAAPKLLESEV